MLHERGPLAVTGGDRVATGPRDLWPHTDGDKQENTMDGMIYGLLVVCVLLVFQIISNVARARATLAQKRIIKSIE